MIEIPEDLLKAWRHYHLWADGKPRAIADLAVLLLAELEESEFKREHEDSYDFSNERPHCSACLKERDGDVVFDLDPRHTYTKDQWKSLAIARLEGR